MCDINCADIHTYILRTYVPLKCVTLIVQTYIHTYIHTIVQLLVYIHVCIVVLCFLGYGKFIQYLPYWSFPYETPLYKNNCRLLSSTANCLRGLCLIAPAYDEWGSSYPLMTMYLLPPLCCCISPSPPIIYTRHATGVCKLCNQDS